MKKTVVLFSLVSVLPLSSMASRFSCKDFEPSHTTLLSCDVVERNESLCVLKDNDDNRIAVGVIKENTAYVTWTFENVKKTSKKLVAHDRRLFSLNRYDVKLEVNADGNGQFKEDIVRNDYVGDSSRSHYSATLKNCQKP